MEGEGSIVLGKGRSTGMEKGIRGCSDCWNMYSELRVRCSRCLCHSDSGFQRLLQLVMILESRRNRRGTRSCGVCVCVCVCVCVGVCVCVKWERDKSTRNTHKILWTTLNNTHVWLLTNPVIIFQCAIYVVIM